MVRVLQVGMGGWGRNWASQVLPSVEGVERVGCVDSSAEALAAARAEGLADEQSCFADLDTAIGATNPELVLVTANLVGHVPSVRTALEAGRHVLVEKPFAATVAEAAELVELAAERRVTLMVSQNYRFYPAVRAVQRLLAGGELGEVHTVHIDFRFCTADGGAGKMAHHLLEEPLLVDMSIHHFDLLRAVLGREAVEVSCRTWNAPWTPFAGPPEGAAIIVLQGGLTTSYSASWISRVTPTPWSGDWRMELERGAVTWTSRGGPGSEKVTVWPAGGEPHELTLPDAGPLDRAGSMTEALRAIREGDVPESSGRDNLGTLALMCAAVESARGGGMPTAVEKVATPTPKG